ncbi:hypothetical protein SARC_15217 [Sphaeroforma arctica JP610]|uniref:Uncharacterized protein n=1 Tax=Sphaeroforma arctica JP610 TaxID=667725 RepID=A0A0L0F6N6_9EUKA|nr:hypothetical protein SARC_15217 [Sphaeroforma arctica JP610]KNC72231.1 hypothetical protein SARC_15217 [Sphaeroforma arctica JP610]|eukprot:XP_014146133.1 hypothetical protein SARC_15217 [Sphaeroforma arctica JP610]
MHLRRSSSIDPNRNRIASLRASDIFPSAQCTGTDTCGLIAPSIKLDSSCCHSNETSSNGSRDNHLSSTVSTGSLDRADNSLGGHAHSHTHTNMNARRSMLASTTSSGTTPTYLSKAHHLHHLRTSPNFYQCMSMPSSPILPRVNFIFDDNLDYDQFAPASRDNPVRREVTVSKATATTPFGVDLIQLDDGFFVAKVYEMMEYGG